MDNKIAEFAQSIYKEGVEKAEIESRRIIDNAETRSKQILDKARQDADSLLAEARRKADELKSNTDAEVKLSGQQALASLKQKIADLILLKSVDAPVKSLLSDPAVIKEFVLLVLQNWTASTASFDLLILLPENKRKELEATMSSALQSMLKKGLEIRYTDEFQAGFQIGPKAASYKISMTDSDFSEFFKAFLRPRTRDFLFGK